MNSGGQVDSGGHCSPNGGEQCGGHWASGQAQFPDDSGLKGSSSSGDTFETSFLKTSK